eukprot:766947-Hanusia_phi.AAC.1
MIQCFKLNGHPELASRSGATEMSTVSSRVGIRRGTHWHRTASDRTVVPGGRPGRRTGVSLRGSGRACAAMTPEAALRLLRGPGPT